MNATKRKFNALVQGIGARSSTSAKSNNDSLTTPDPPAAPRPSTSSYTTANMAVENDLLAKRRRLAALSEKSAAVNSTNAGVTNISNVVLKKWTPATNGKESVQEPAKYRPSDRGDLLRRLATFQELTDWTPKPDKVNEIEWAKRGWVCQRKERVRCTLCNKELVVKLNKREVDGQEVPVLIASEVGEALVEKYAELIVTSHQEECLWRKRGCDDSLLRLSLTNAKASLETLRQRYDELCGRKSFLPYEFNLRLPEELNIDLILTQLPEDFFVNPPPSQQSPEPQQPNRVALALAVMGWQGLSNVRIGAVPNSASCHTCLRRLGLWMFKSKQVGENNEILVPAPMDHLDPAKEHRFFCPWKNGQAQKLGSADPDPEVDMPGWKVLVQVIKNDAYLRGALDDRPKSRVRPKTRDGNAAPFTPGKTGTTASGALDTGGLAPPLVIGPDGVEEEDEGARDVKDKERWARLRRVKSLFDTKGGKKLRRTLSRPGTGHSTISGGGQA